MSDVVFRASTPAPTSTESEPTPELTDRGAEHDVSDIEPVEDAGQATLDALGIGDAYRDLPAEESGKVDALADYVKAVVEQKGLSPTRDAYKKALESLKEQVGLDSEANPSVVIDRLGGVVRAWRELSFISDPKEKRALFMRLARLETSEAMHKEVFRLMNERRIWQ